MINHILDDIYQLQVPMPFNLGEVNCYLFKGKNGYTIVDTGDDTEEVKEIWKQVIPEISPIEKIVLTHAHPDHLGLAKWFKENYDVPIWMADRSYNELLRTQTLFKDGKYYNPQAEISLLHGGPEMEPEKEGYYKLSIFNFEPDVLFKEDEEIPLGDVMYQPIWTPGHSVDHYCFYNPENKVFLVGDHLLNAINTVVISESLEQNSLNDYFNSIEKIENIPAKYILPGHGELIDDLKARIERMRNHYDKRLKLTLSSIDEKGSSAYEVAKIVYSDRFNSISAMPAFVQIITNLIYLESLGHVQMSKQNDKVIYKKSLVKEKPHL